MQSEINTKELHHFLYHVSAQAQVEERQHIERLAQYLYARSFDHKKIAARAAEYILCLRNEKQRYGAEDFFHEYGLETKESLAIMGLAEGLIRVPDAETAHDLLHDKLEGTSWSKYIGKKKSSMVNASAIGLQLAEQLSHWGSIIQRITDPIVREAVRHGVRFLSERFVLGQTIDDALGRSQKYIDKGYVFSYDQLGEGARSQMQAEHYFYHYLALLESLSTTIDASISVKLSALCPRLEYLRKEQVLKTLMPRLQALIAQAKRYKIRITFDAEETMRHDLMLIIFEQIYEAPVCEGYEGLGLAVQAYHKQAFDTITWLIKLAQLHGRRIPVRLVKGAYWDGEIKQAQVEGLNYYPVFTKKPYTDISYLACAQQMLEYPEAIYPQFATHNAYTIAAIEELAGTKEFEFQLLFGMGQALYDSVVSKHRVRIYAPIGKYHELLPYLIRRLIENGSSSSFVKVLGDEQVPLDRLVANPLDILDPQFSASLKGKDIPLPTHILPGRENSSAIAFGNKEQVETLQTQVKSYYHHHYDAYSIIAGKRFASTKKPIQNVFAPYNLSQKVGLRLLLNEEEHTKIVAIAVEGHKKWSKTSVIERYNILQKLAKQIEFHQAQIIALLIQEAGKTIKDAIAEVRETIDYCRYYASEACRLMEQDIVLPSPTGETNMLNLYPRGVFVCISPWNFPAAIFTGQIVAALAAGNAVIAKPAEPTCLIATYLIQLMHRSGVPAEALNLVITDGTSVSKYILSDTHIAGVAFTGSLVTAQKINRILAARNGSIASFIAETGGQNVMIVDSTALLEQTVDDIIISAFGSSGQRCSSCRIVLVQEEIAPALEELLQGALQELIIGSPEEWSTDLGPLINQEAQRSIKEYIATMQEKYPLLAKAPAYKGKEGFFVEPHIFRVPSISSVGEEVFGPILHLAHYRHDQLDEIIQEINASGYGLTFGIQSRIGKKCEYIRERIHAGNSYVNRSMIGAVVGVQPFGGEGLSGTGFKAGGPHYLLRFMVERTYSVNTTAIGGNRELLE